MTRFRCDGIFNDSFIANFQEIVKVKKIVNRSVFDEVMPKILLVRFFSGHGVDPFRRYTRSKSKVVRNRAEIWTFFGPPKF